jgi:hypothetical protein
MRGSTLRLVAVGVHFAPDDRRLRHAILEDAVCGAPKPAT